MPANTTPFVIRTPERKCGDSQHFAAVLEFNTTDLERIQYYLDRLYAQGVICKPATARAFDPNFTSAELYFP